MSILYLLLHIAGQLGEDGLLDDCCFSLFLYKRIMYAFFFNILM